MHINTNKKYNRFYLLLKIFIQFIRDINNIYNGYLCLLIYAPPPFLKKKWVVYRGIYNSRVIVLAMTSDGKETKKYVVESYLLGSF